MSSWCRGRWRNRWLITRLRDVWVGVTTIDQSSASLVVPWSSIYAFKSSSSLCEPIADSTRWNTPENVLPITTIISCRRSNAAWDSWHFPPPQIWVLTKICWTKTGATFHVANSYFHDQLVFLEFQMGETHRTIPPRKLQALPTRQPKRIHSSVTGGTVSAKDSAVLQRQQRRKKPELPGLQRGSERTRNDLALRSLLAVSTGLQYQRKTAKRI